VELAERLPGALRALGEGRIDLTKAKAIIEHTTHLAEAEDRRLVEERVLARANTQTAPELRRSLLHAVHAVDPAATVKRRAKAQADRGVHLQPLPDAMAEITAVLPAEDAVTVFTALDVIAQSADPADQRPVAARRADALTDLCRNLLAVGYMPERSAHRGVVSGPGSFVVGTSRSGGGGRGGAGVVGRTFRSPSRRAPCSEWTSSPVSWPGTGRYRPTLPGRSRTTRTRPGDGCSPTRSPGCCWTTAPRCTGRHPHSRGMSGRATRYAHFPAAGNRRSAVIWTIGRRFRTGRPVRPTSGHCAATITGPRPRAAGAGDATTTASSPGPHPPATST
jgi:Domain of unknown function (DUF222)